MLRSFLILVFHGVIGVLHGQSIPLRGTVAIQNSAFETGERKYISGASVRAPFAKATASDRDGSFTLDLMGLDLGAPVRIAVSKPGYVVVNARDLEHCVLGTPMVQVVMADPARLDAARIKFHDITTTSIDKAFERRMRALRDTTRHIATRLDDLGRELDDTIPSLMDAIELLTEQRNDALIASTDLADRLSLMDVDQANEDLRRAYGLFLKGDHEAALRMLDSERLDRAMGSALERKGRGEALVQHANMEIRQLAMSRQLKVDVLLATLNYPPALECQQALRRMMSDNTDAFDPVMRVRQMTDMALLLERLGKPAEGVPILDEALLLVPPVGGEEQPIKAVVECAYASLLLALDDQAGALARVQRAIAIGERQTDGDPIGLGRSYRMLAQVLRAEKRMDQALAAAERSKLLFAIGRGQRSLEVGWALNTIGLCHMDLGSMDSARVVLEESITIQRATGHEDDPELAASYGNLAVVQEFLGSMQEALANKRKARSIFLRSLDRDNPTVIVLENNLAFTFLETNELDSALYYYRSCLSSAERVLGKNHSALGTLHTNLASALRQKGDLTGALAENRKGMAIIIAAKGPEHPSLVMDYNSLGVIYFNLDQDDSAMVAYDTALRLNEMAYGPGHYDEALVRANKAELLLRQGRPDLVLQEARIALAINQRELGEKSAQTAGSHSKIADAFHLLGQYDSSFHHNARALEVLREQGGTDDPQITQILRNTADDWCSIGRSDLALAYADTSLVLAISGSGAGSLYTALSHSMLGRVQCKSKDFEAADVNLRRALEIYQADTIGSRANVADAWIDLSALSLESGDHGMALMRADSSLAATSTSLGFWTKAKALNAMGDTVQALAFGVQALRMQGPKPPFVAPELKDLRSFVITLATEQEREDILKEFETR